MCASQHQSQISGQGWLLQEGVGAFILSASSDGSGPALGWTLSCQVMIYEELLYHLHLFPCPFSD